MTSAWIHAQQVLSVDGWLNDCYVEITHDGRIGRISGDRVSASSEVDVLLPAMGNLHSHSFQRAMAGLTEFRGQHSQDNFWTWRELMYRFVQRLELPEMMTIAAQVQTEMLEAGFASVGEFHYLHHQPDGVPYTNPGESSLALLEVAKQTGIGYTHLPVLYMRGGLDERKLEGGQKRFYNSIDDFIRLHEETNASVKACADDFRIGVAPHSLRAVPREGLSAVQELEPPGPVHIHFSEQNQEVAQVIDVLGKRPVEWLFDNADVDERWCLIHATHISRRESEQIGRSGAVVGLCPITEANLGDGIFPMKQFTADDGRFGIGSDSNVHIGLAEEFRLLEYSQRLVNEERAVVASQEFSCGRYLYESASRGAAQALERDSGRIQEGAVADLVAIGTDNAILEGASGDRVLDAWIFCGDNRIVSDVWAGGRHVVTEGKHKNHELIETRFRSLMKKLRSSL